MTAVELLGVPLDVIALIFLVSIAWVAGLMAGLEPPKRTPAPTPPPAADHDVIGDPAPGATRVTYLARGGLTTRWVAEAVALDDAVLLYDHDGDLVAFIPRRNLIDIRQ